MFDELESVNHKDHEANHKSIHQQRDESSCDEVPLVVIVVNDCEEFKGKHSWNEEKVDEQISHQIAVKSKPLQEEGHVGDDGLQLDVVVWNQLIDFLRERIGHQNSEPYCESLHHFDHKVVERAVGQNPNGSDLLACWPLLRRVRNHTRGKVIQIYEVVVKENKSVPQVLKTVRVVQVSYEGSHSDQEIWVRGQEEICSQREYCLGRGEELQESYHSISWL